MAIEVGTDSYFAIAAADAYFAGRGVAAWAAATTEQKEAAARRGTSYLDNAYRGRWIGYRSEQAQTLAWPRYSDDILYDSDGYEIPDDAIPAPIATAAMEAALVALSGVTLEPRLERGGAIKSLTETIGPISTSTTWMDGAPLHDRYLAIEGLLRGWVTGSPGASSGNVRLVRS